MPYTEKKSRKLQIYVYTLTHTSTHRYLYEIWLMHVLNRASVIFLGMTHTQKSTKFSKTENTLTLELEIRKHVVAK